ncbi:MAG TPA: glycosyltransferase family 4 protein, partial [Myxococcota bacterium]|nr:glycosyltransferase family 4 protein [Myxococcota bacterium]
MSGQEPPLRILHTEASLGWGGQEIRILTEARGVARLGHEVLLAAAPGARILEEAPRFGVAAMALPIGRKRPGGVRALRRLLSGGRFDVVNAHSSTDAWLAALACATLAAAPALVRTRHISSPTPR